MNQKKTRCVQHLLCGVMTGAIIFAGFSVGQAMAQFAQVQPYISPKKEITVPENYQTYLLEAMRIHATQYQMNTLLSTTHANVLATDAQVAVLDEQVTALNTCNEERLSDVYQNPKEAWDKMTSEYANRVNNLKIYINASEPSQAEDNAEQAFPTWRVGREVLIDVYAEPEKYGTLRSPDSGFKRWKDQDYIYAEQVNNFLVDVVQKLGVSAVPGVSRENTYSQNAQAYQAFLADMRKNNTQRYNRLSKEQLSFPLPPDPLPPANEIIKLTADSSQGQLFPAMPDPWAYYMKNPNVKRLPNGEMNEYYQPDSLRLRMDVASKNIDNRFEVFQRKKTSLATTKETARLHRLAQDNEKVAVENSLKQLGIQMPFDIERPEALKDELVKRKRAAIGKARTLLAEKATYDASGLSDNLVKFQSLTLQDKLKALDEIDRNSEDYATAITLLNSDQKVQDEIFLDAMEKDINGEAMLTQVNAKDAEQLVKAARAQGALVRTIQEEQRKYLEKERAKKLNADCFFDGDL